ncbi:nuclear transport factor 2 family protein [Iodobacter arcticus]|uniref:Nuclear transport factor 2 family protein n=1 Tax=Iodobacter arcticus TaxID=590593 RepID=A0ABW2R5Q2_9NEIS
MKIAQSDEIRELAKTYIEALHQHNIPLLSSLFHLDAALSGFMDGQYDHVPIARWIDQVKQMPIQHKAQSESEILRVDGSNEYIASVKLTHTFQGIHFLNDLSLVKENERWLIIHKNFSGVYKL